MFFGTDDDTDIAILAPMCLNIPVEEQNMYIESDHIELKEKYNDNFVREVVSFLNADGGNIYIGIRDDGKVIGAQNVDSTLKQISDCITDQIQPSPRNEIKTEINYDDGVPVIVVKVCKGIRPIYCVRKYGFSSKGCLIRIGSTCKEMTSAEIQYRYRQQLIDGDAMLQVPARYAPLSFDMMKILLTGRGLHINENAFDASFNLKCPDGRYNLMAEILSDHNMVPLIFVKFSGTDKTSISQRSDYGTQSILLGYQKLKDRLTAENICRTDTTVRPRIDRYLYDMNCVNEALVNMIVHNDWTITEPLVSFYSDRVVFTSHGGLPHGMTEEEFFEGVSHPRNSVLMRIFLNLGIVEHTGHGVPVIVRKYGREAFSIHNTYVNVTIPFDREVMASVSKIGNDAGTDVGLDRTVQGDAMTENEQNTILEVIKNPRITYSELAKETGLSRRTVSRVMAALVLKNYIERVGNNKSGYWKVVQ